MRLKVKRQVVLRILFQKSEVLLGLSKGYTMHICNFVLMNGDQFPRKRMSIT